MKKIALLLIFLFASAISHAQEIKTIFENDNFKSITGFGGLMISYTNFNNYDGIISGVRGGAIFNRKLTVGITAVSFDDNAYFIGNDFYGRNNAQLILENGMGGLYLEYSFNLAKPIHFSVPLSVMFGHLQVKNSLSDLYIEQDTFVAFEPGINLEFNVAKFFIPCISITYRQAFGVKLQNNITNRDISGLNVGVIFKFGNF